MMYLYIALLSVFALFLSGCSQDKKQDEIHFATFAEYPPFEYYQRGEIKGFDIDLAKLVASELGKTAVFDNMQFSTILPSIISGKVDAAIATITITSERQKNFDFTIPYYFSGMAVLYKTKEPINNIAELKVKKIGAQIGSVMEIWLRKHFRTGEISTLNTNNQALEALIAGHVDAVLVDGAQASVYSKKHPGISNTLITKADSGYGIALKKGSPLTTQMNQALKKLKADGHLEKLKAKWFGGVSWKP